MEMQKAKGNLLDAVYPMLEDEGMSSFYSEIMEATSTEEIAVLVRQAKEALHHLQMYYDTEEDVIRAFKMLEKIK